MRTAFIQRRSILKAVLYGTAFSVLPVSAYAHRQKRSVSSVVWNTQTNLLEVTHILHLHDAEQALSRIGKLTSPDLTPLRARAQLALYAQEHFRLTDASGAEIPLSIVGAEVENGQAYIYQEAKLAQVPHELYITDTLLLDIYSDQTNLVNISLGGEVKSLVFKSGDHAKRVSA